MERLPMVAGNWKMNGNAKHVDDFGRSLVDAASSLKGDLVVCVPFVYVAQLARIFDGSPVAAGGQDVSGQTEPGAFTGEISASMLIDCGAQYVIVGHSERRAMHAETDELVAAKAEAAHAAGLIPIVCVGETLEERESGRAKTVLSRQIDALIRACSRATMSKMVLAYEPIWAIGTGRSATPEQAQDTHSFLRERVAEWDREVAKRLQVLYGGSVKPDNARLLFSGADVDGALVGGASLEAGSFLDIARALD